MADTPPADDLAGSSRRPAARTPIADRLAALEEAERERYEQAGLEYPPPPDPLDDAADESGGGWFGGIHLSFRSRLTFGLLAAAVLPLALFGIAALVVGRGTITADVLTRALL